ncbi:hypothetical protein [Eubacterium aggregans]|uniref:hypothetical protein n=1 Tax=Eubacterium aggregans TaxID=81409 RepID=UPI003F2B3882
MKNVGIIKFFQNRTMYFLAVMLVCLGVFPLVTQAAGATAEEFVTPSEDQTNGSVNLTAWTVVIDGTVLKLTAYTGRAADIVITKLQDFKADSTETKYQSCTEVHISLEALQSAAKSANQKVVHSLFLGTERIMWLLISRYSQRFLKIKV